MTSRSSSFLADTRFWRRVSIIVCLAALSPLDNVATAQLIGIRTVPVAQGDQLGFLPSASLGMGGVSIALDDPLRDPFVNPATAARVKGAQFVGSPSFYAVSKNGGSGRTLPVGGLFKAGSSFAGLTLALQEITAAGPPQTFFGPGVLDVSFAPGPDPNFFGPVQETHTNRYAFATVGHSLSKQKLSFGGSVFWSGLTGMDGVEMLYANARGIRQFGQALDFRLGMLKEWAGDQSLEIVAVHNRFGMTHDVNYLDSFWDPGTRQVQFRPRVEHNVDRTNTSGLHLEYQRPFADSGWRIGGLLTANRMSHPKIPNYEIMNIPRDPGLSSAYNIGVGVSRSYGAVRFGADVVYEPIWSDTWADAETEIVTDSGAIIPAGGKTIENHFQFSNALLRLGASRDFSLDHPGSSFRMQVGVQTRSINYNLDQFDNVRVRPRALEEGWTEWTYSWGASFRFPDVEVHYRWRSTSGTGRPGVGGDFAVRAGGLEAASQTILIAPSGPLTLDPVRVTTHQFSVSVPLK